MVKCPKCDGHSFKVEEVAPNQSNYKLMFVACNSCSTAVGVMDYFNIGTLVKTLEKKVEELESKVQRQDSNIDTVNKNVGTVIRMLQQKG